LVKIFDGIPPNPTVAGVETAQDFYLDYDRNGIISLGGEVNAKPDLKKDGPDKFFRSFWAIIRSMLGLQLG